MKFTKLLLSFMVSISLFTGCTTVPQTGDLLSSPITETENNTSEVHQENEIIYPTGGNYALPPGSEEIFDEQLTIGSEIGVTKESNYADAKLTITLNSASIEHGRITIVTGEDLGYVFDRRDMMQADGQIGEYSFLTVNITVLSDKKLENIFISPCKLYYRLPNNSEWYYEECCYQSEYELEDPLMFGCLSFQAQESKEIVLGYIVEPEILEAESVSFYYSAADTIVVFKLPEDLGGNQNA